MATKKTEKKTPAKQALVKPAAIPKTPAKKTGGVPAAPATPSQEPTARLCPLVLDGEMRAAAFNPNKCFSCDEFDCRFCEAAHGSGALRSRLFVSEEDGDSDGRDDDGWDCDPEFSEDGDDEADDGGDEDDDPLY